MNTLPLYYCEAAWVVCLDRINQFARNMDLHHPAYALDVSNHTRDLEHVTKCRCYEHGCGAMVGRDDATNRLLELDYDSPEWRQLVETAILHLADPSYCYAVPCRLAGV